jgi:uncharacterized YceG family protein
VALGGFLLVVGAAAAIAAPHLHQNHPLPPPPPPHEYKILFPEGFTRAQMAARVGAVAKIAKREKHDKTVRLSEHAYLAATTHLRVPCFTPALQKKPEGFLFPSTYDFIAKEPSKQLVQAQLTAFCENWQKLDLSYARSKNLTPYEVLEIASMIQGEVRVPSENRLVAAVIYNRLHQHMTLGIDATLRYGLHLAPGAPLTQSELQSENQYNTRKFPGLPPTPIDNPGFAAIQAAAHPAHVDYLYYLKIPHSKRSYFTASYQDFYNHEVQWGYAP